HLDPGVVLIPLQPEASRPDVAPLDLAASVKLLGHCGNVAVDRPVVHDRQPVTVGLCFIVSLCRLHALARLGWPTHRCTSEPCDLLQMASLFRYTSRNNVTTQHCRSALLHLTRKFPEIVTCYAGFLVKQRCDLRKQEIGRNFVQICAWA